MNHIKIHPDYEAIVSKDLQKKVADINRYRSLEFRRQAYLSGTLDKMDEELFAYIMSNHDWYAGYSDDGNVWRRANVAEGVFEDIVKRHPELQSMLTTARATRTSPDIPGGPVMRYCIHPLEKPALVIVDNDDGPRMPIDHWLLLSQFHCGMNLLVNYWRSLDRALNVWYIDGVKAREHIVTANGTTHPILTIALPAQIQRQLDVSEDLIAKYFELMTRESEYVVFGKHLDSFTLDIQPIGNGTRFYNVVSAGNKVVFSFII